MCSAQKRSHSSACIIDPQKGTTVSNGHGDHTQQIRSSSLGPARNLRKHRLIHLRKQNSQPGHLIQIVLILCEPFVVQPMREDVLLGLDPHIFNRMVELVTQHEPIQFVEELFSEDLGLGLGLRFDWPVG